MKTQTHLLQLAAMAALGLALAPAAGAAGPGMQTISFEETMTLDALGDATYKVTFTLTASQYANWHQKYGENKSLIKRDVGKAVSQFDTYDWTVQVNEMERRVEVGVKAHGAVKHLGGGRYELDVPKQWKGGTRSAHGVDFNYVEPMGIDLIGQYNVKVILPPEASELVDATGEAGEKVLRYQVPVASGGPNLILVIAGGVALAAGLVLVWAGLKRRPSATLTRPAARLPPPVHAPIHHPPLRPIAGPPPRRPPA